MAPADDPNALMYTPCSATLDGAMGAVLHCKNEGWLFCTLCHAYFCDDHACIHLSAQVNSDAVREVSSESDTMEDARTPEHGSGVDAVDSTRMDAESRAFFRELSSQQLADAGEIALRSYFRRLLSEAKRIQREIERRMIYATEMQGGPAYRRKRFQSQDEIDAQTEKRKRKLDLTPLGLLEREQRELRQKELQRKKQEAIQANIAILANQIKLGNLSIDDVKRVLKK